MPAIVVPGKENAGSFLRVPLLARGADQKNGRQSVQDCIPTLERGNDQKRAVADLAFLRCHLVCRSRKKRRERHLLLHNRLFLRSVTLRILTFHDAIKFGD